MILGEDWFDHYGTNAIYLRVNGITPPSAQQGMGRMQAFPACANQRIYYFER